MTYKTHPADINHQPVFKIDKVINKYRQAGENFKYVCTTDLLASDVPVDIFYRDAPHPIYGNHYMGLFVGGEEKKVYVCNADLIENLEFGMIQDSKGAFHYSQSHHHYNEIEADIFIDGGRQYVRAGGTPLPELRFFQVKDGKFEEIADIAERTYEGKNE